jgi:predicted AAA+ superfamily ATPase
MIVREQLKNISDQCFRGKIIMLLGARQTGKTTLLKQLAKNSDKKTNWLNADEADIFESFSKSGTSSELLQLAGNQTELLIIDEAQQITDIGKKLKLIYDTKPELQIIVTGSSAFELNNHTQEALTGRKRVFHLYPISFMEIAESHSLMEAKRLVETRILFGSYPEVINNPGAEKQVLHEIAESYLYRDILQVEGIRKSGQIQKLLQALALQIGSEVNFQELAKTIGNINPATVEKYIELLEKTYVIFKLPALSRNLRNEIKKGKKYFFCDNGIRNILLNNFLPLELRNDKGALWENWLIAERMKQNHYFFKNPNCYFWRTHDQAEIDYIEETDGLFQAFEIKWKEQNVKFPESFLKAYPENITNVINRNNYPDFLELHKDKQ